MHGEHRPAQLVLGRAVREVDSNEEDEGFDWRRRMTDATLLLSACTALGRFLELLINNLG
ncbi:hypothetical protein ACVU7I_01525 [Patulibacter sp. S7RM1-6]